MGAHAAPTPPRWQGHTQNRLTAKTKHVKMLLRFRQLRKSYLSLSCLSGALACYLSLIAYPLPILTYLRDSLSAVICHILEVGTPILSPTYTLSPPPLFNPKPPRKERASPQTSATPRASPAIQTLPLSIALLSIWGASLLPIANCLSSPI